MMVKKYCTRHLLIKYDDDMTKTGNTIKISEDNSSRRLYLIKILYVNGRIKDKHIHT